MLRNVNRTFPLREKTRKNSSIGGREIPERRLDKGEQEEGNRCQGSSDRDGKRLLNIN